MWSGNSGDLFPGVKTLQTLFQLPISPNSVLWEFVGAEFRLSTKQICGDPISRWDLRGGIGSGRLNYIEKYEAVCDLCGGLIALMKKELKKRLENTRS